MTIWRAAFAGLIGALAMSAFFLATRLTLSVPTPSEMFADWSAPHIPVGLFGLLIQLARGYTPLKVLGFSGVIAGQLIVGGVLAAIAFRAAPARRAVALVGLAALAWAGSIALFWPVLLTNYRGLPAAHARAETISVLAVGYALFAIITFTAYRLNSPVLPSYSFDARRRDFLAAGLAVGFALAGGILWRALFSRSALGYDGTIYEGPAVQAITPASQFYVVTKNVIDPDIDPRIWRLSVAGALAKPRTYDLAGLRALPSIEQETTLMCINNDVDGGLMSNALWRGVRLRDLIAVAGPSEGVQRVAFHAADNYIETVPYERAMLATTLLAYEMNGVPLPRRHGFPLRAIVPGLFGERNPKWIDAITLETTPVRGFYERQGWGPNFQVQTHARFDVPNFTETLSLGSIEMRGVAFAGDRGVSSVEISFDGGATWSATELISPYRQLAWRLWRYQWRPLRPGTYRLVVRATDGAGNVQTATRRPTSPQGATGRQEVIARVA